MRAEDRDWQIYHIIVEKSEMTVDEICRMTGTEESVTEESLKRLHKYHLISRKEDTCTPKSIQEIFVTAELKRAMEDSPIYMEDGVIKVRKESEDE